MTAAGFPPALAVVSAFLGLSLVAYGLLAGADFGAGILELWWRRGDRGRLRNLVYRAMGPVWEANHIWLILAVVILFMGFPAAYAFVSVRFHLPLTALLLGIIARGCSFTFRHYDAYREVGPQRYYSIFFALSSLFSPLMLGVLAGAALLGDLGPGELDFYSLYLRPWLHALPFALGLFAACLFTWLAAIYLIGECDPATEAGLRRELGRKAGLASLICLAAGALVFAAAEWDGLPLLSAFFSSPFNLACLVAATVALPALWYGLRRGWAWRSRCAAGFILTCILAAWFRVQFPALVRTDAGDITLFNAAAPPETLRQLAWALVVGSALILPALGYLIKVFKLRDE